MTLTSLHQPLLILIMVDVEIPVTQLQDMSSLWLGSHHLEQQATVVLSTVKSRICCYVSMCTTDGTYAQLVRQS